MHATKPTIHRLHAYYAIMLAGLLGASALCVAAANLSPIPVVFLALVPPLLFVSAVHDGGGWNAPLTRGRALAGAVFSAMAVTVALVGMALAAFEPMRSSIGAMDASRVTAMVVFIGGPVTFVAWSIALFAMIRRRSRGLVARRLLAVTSVMGVGAMAFAGLIHLVTVTTAPSMTFLPGLASFGGVCLAALTVVWSAAALMAVPLIRR